MNRSFNADRFNEIFAHPKVKPHVDLGLDKVDLSPIILNRDNVCFLDPFGGFICVRNIIVSSFDVHTLFLPEGRGTRVIGLAKEAANDLFRFHGATFLETFVKDGNFAAKRLALSVGFYPSHEETIGTWAGTRYYLRKK